MDFQNISFYAEYRAGEKDCTAMNLKNEHFDIALHAKNGRIEAVLIPHTPVAFRKLEFRMPYAFTPEDKIFVNGYQSWTDSFEYSVGEQMRELTELTEFCITKTPLKSVGFPKSGDTLFHSYPRKNNVFYGWSYGYVRRGGQIALFGSLNERCGYTVVTFDAGGNTVTVSKDLEGVVLEKETAILSFAVICGEYDAAFDEYFSQMGVACRENKRRTGYTTWYNYYGNINEQVVMRDLNSIAALDIPFDCFQIDDGYQVAIGDWLITDSKKFPSGMKAVADAIHSRNMLAGLWLAPFAVTKKSRLYQLHPDWLVRDKNGKPYKTGHNWGGFYSLDIYHEGARQYIKEVFRTALYDWGYDMVKLDFLYGACVLPLHNKSRGEVMCDAMDFLRECCGDKLILGCGVPLMPAFGKVDYCRIGSDISLAWKTRKHIIREEVSTPHAVANTVFRRHLDGRAWKNDPDVFLLRDSNIHLSFAERELLSRINSMFGNLLFISDNVAEYSPRQIQVLKEAFARKNVRVQSAELTGQDMMDILYTEENRNRRLRFSIRTGRIEADE